MLDKRKFADVHTMLSSDSVEQICAGLWKGAVLLEQYTSHEQEQVLAEVRNIVHANNQRSEADAYEVSAWLIHFINNTTAVMSPEQRDLAVEVIIDALRSPNKILIKNTLEAIGRKNYLFGPQHLDTIVAAMAELNQRPDVANFTEDLLLTSKALMDYCSAANKERLQSLLVQRKTADQRAYLEIEGPSITEGETADVVFYIPEYLSGKSFIQPPVGVVSAATVLRESGYGVKVIDNRIYHLSPATINELVTQLGAKTVVMITTTYDQVSVYYVDYRWKIIQNALAELQKCGRQVIICGSHGTVLAEQVLREAPDSIIVKGEWEYTLRSLLNTVRDGDWSWQRPELEGVANLAWRGDEGIVTTAFDHDLFYPDVESLPMPDYSVADLKGYYGDEYSDNVAYAKDRWGSILAQRGCPYSCSYCYLFFGKKVRKRTPQQVADEAEMLVKQHGVRHLFFIDYTFTVDKHWTREVCNELITRNLDVPWNCETRADCVDPETLALMKRAGCQRIWVGVETFADPLLEQCGKRVDEISALDAINMIRDSGIAISAFMMVGLEKETPESIQYSLKKLKEHGVEYTKSIITVIPRFGAPFGDAAKQAGVAETFEEAYAVRGLINNEIDETHLISTIQTMKQRDFSQWSV